jgi:hypothetical protein
MTNDTTIAAIKATPTMAPMTPPAMEPASELRCEAEVDPDALGVKVDWETLDVDRGTVEAVPVTSGVSGTRTQHEYICVYTAEGHRTSYGL